MAVAEGNDTRVSATEENYLSSNFLLPTHCTFLSAFIIVGKGSPSATDVLDGSNSAVIVGNANSFMADGKSVYDVVLMI